MTAHSAYLLNEATAEFLAYEATAEFRLYLVAKSAWETIKAAYAGPDEVWYAEERLAYSAMTHALLACRLTPEHKAAFGW